MPGIKPTSPLDPGSTSPTPRTIHWPDGPGDWEREAGAKHLGPVVRIIVGRLEGKSEAAEGKKSERPDRARAGTALLPERFASLFGDLTHLYLWNLPTLTELPALPETLECLEVRGCENLSKVVRLPAGLHSLVLDGCTALRLTGGHLPECFPALEDLSLRDYPGIERSEQTPKQTQEWFDDLLRRCPKLRRLDASGCQWLRRIGKWPPELVDARFRGCAALATLPSTWPTGLRRLDLNGGEAIQSLPRFSAKLDYVDLTAARSLVSLRVLDSASDPSPDGPSPWPSTLILHQSGVRVPPASEHGEAGQNVSKRVRQHFKLRALTGVGKVRRCKVLVLGNGSAGKTCLSLRLVPGHDVKKECKRLGSTHGVQFFPWPFDAAIEGAMQPVQLHLWDFGGQEIYHNTHRIFMSTGSVFLVLWNPSQDGKSPPQGPMGYQDRWHSLRYWLDLIRLERPHGARIAIVGSYEDTRAPEDPESPKGSHGRPHCTLEEAKAFKRKLEAMLDPSESRAVGFFCVDAWNGLGEVAELKEWLEQEVGEEILAAGQEVPACWEPAQRMVESWLEEMSQDGGKAERRRMVTFDDFHSELRRAIETAIAPHRDPGVRAGRGGGGPLGAPLEMREGTDYSQLAAAIEGSRFALGADEVEGVLRFLTRSGWLYWDERLADRQVIIGQKWALDGIYAILDRNPCSGIHLALVRNCGVFTLSDLRSIEGFGWNGKYSPKEQQLLLSFMEQCGLCFKVRRAESALFGEDVFVSVEHLPSGKEIRDAFSAPTQDGRSVARDVHHRSLHRLHWQAVLTRVGKEYGHKAKYAQDAISLENVSGQKVLLTFHPEPSGFGGFIGVVVSVVRADKEAARADRDVMTVLQERCDQVVQWLRGMLPADPGGGTSAVTPVDHVAGVFGQSVEVIKVFLSYTWNEPEVKDGPHTPPPYEEPVDAIKQFLEDPARVDHAAEWSGGRRFKFDVIRDKDRVTFGDSIAEFMKQLGICDRIIVVHSDKFWRSPYCMYELRVLRKGPQGVARDMLKWVIPIEHRYDDAGQRVGDRRGITHWEEYWRKYAGPVPQCWEHPQTLQEEAASAVRWIGEIVDDKLDVNVRWDRESRECLDVILRRATTFVEGETPRGSNRGRR